MPFSPKKLVIFMNKIKKTARSCKYKKILITFVRTKPEDKYEKIYIPIGGHDPYNSMP